MYSLLFAHPSFRFCLSVPLSVFQSLPPIVEILNLDKIILFTHLHHFFPVSIHYLQCIYCLLNYKWRTISLALLSFTQYFTFVFYLFFLTLYLDLFFSLPTCQLMLSVSVLIIFTLSSGVLRLHLQPSTCCLCCKNKLSTNNNNNYFNPFLLLTAFILMSLKLLLCNLTLCNTDTLITKFYKKYHFKMWTNHNSFGTVVVVWEILRVV